MIEAVVFSTGRQFWLQQVPWVKMIAVYEIALEQKI